MIIVAIAGLSGLIIIACNSHSSNMDSIIKNYFHINEAIGRTHKGITYINGNVANGYLIQINANNDTLFLEAYINGRKQGTCYAKYPNLQYQSLQYFENGKAEGLQQTWWENGRLKEEAYYKNDVFHGKFKEYDTNGMLTRDNNYVDGHEEGKQKMWYDNGKLRANYVVKNGRIYGLSGTMNCFNAVEKKKLSEP